jgi:uncharacterized protein
VTKAVIDANVWVSGLIARGNSSRIVDLFRSGGFQAFCSPELIDELAAVLARPRIAQRIQPELAHQLLDLLKTKAGFASLESIPQISRDPKDDAYLACARAAKCDFPVSGGQRSSGTQRVRGNEDCQSSRFCETSSSFKRALIQDSLLCSWHTISYLMPSRSLKKRA